MQGGLIIVSALFEFGSKIVLWCVSILHFLQCPAVELSKSKTVNTFFHCFSKISNV